MKIYYSVMRQTDLDIDLLRTFAIVAETHSFTAAGDILGRTQSAISQQIRRLEDAVGKELLTRTSRSVALTPAGEILLSHAHRIILLNDETMRRLAAPPITGHLRLGVSEDFIPLQLPRLLAHFARAHPGVKLELMTGLSTTLVNAMHEGLLDVVIAKRDAQSQSGRVIWREQLVWIIGCDEPVDLPGDGGAVPLVVLPPPCSYRKVMLDVLGGAKRAWSISCTTHSLMGLQAAVAGGLGVSVSARSFLQPGVRELDADRVAGFEPLPALPSVEIALFGEPNAPAELTGGLVNFLVDGLRTLRSLDAGGRAQERPGCCGGGR